MNELNTLYNNIHRINTDWKNISEKFFRSFEPDFVDLIQYQLTRGEDGDKNRLHEYLSKSYANLKKSMGSISSPFADLNFEGDFYEGMYMDDFNEITSSDWKTEKLVEKYGDAILDPQAELLAKLVDDQIIPEIIDFLQKEIMKGI